LILGTVLIAKCRQCCHLHATVANLRHFHTKTWPAGCRISALKPAKDRVFDYFGTLDGLWRSRQPKTFAWGANREPYSIMEYLPATGIADGHPAREAVRAGAVIADSLPSGSLRVDRIGFGVVDAVVQRLDRRRRRGIRHHRELDRRPRVRLLGLRDQELPARWRSGSGRLHLRCQAPRYPVGCGLPELQVRRSGRREVLIRRNNPNGEAPAQAGAFSFVQTLQTLIADSRPNP
jgi:hypothetical protein